MKNIRERAKTPPMGWNSWDCFSVTVNEEEVKENARFMAEHLKEYGWEYIVVDLGWYAPGVDHTNYKKEHIHQLIDSYGRLIPDPEKFPSSTDGEGFKPLADYVHSLGLKFGIHIMRGIPVQAVENNCPVMGTGLRAGDISYDRERCPWYNSLRTLDFSMPEAQEYYNSIFKMYAEWGVDYIKADDVNAWHEVNNSDGSPTGEGSPYRIDDIEGIAKAIENSGRSMVLSISPGGPETTVINHLRNHANLWRISADFWDEWGSLRKQMERCAIWAPFVQEGNWPDADMLPLGYLPRGESGGQDRYTNFTQNEQITLITLWSVFRSPLMFGGHLPACDDFTISLITNPEVIYVNQYSKNAKCIYADEKYVIWQAGDSQSSDSFLAVFNLSEEECTIPLNTLIADPDRKKQIRDLWTGKNLKVRTNDISCFVEGHGAKLFRVS